MAVCAMCGYSKTLCDIATLNGKWLKKINGGKSIAFEHLLLIFGREVDRKTTTEKTQKELEKKANDIPNNVFALSGNLTINN